MLHLQSEIRSDQDVCPTEMAESVLWRAVMIISVRDALNNRLSPLPEHTEQRRAAWRWIRDDINRVGSFTWVAEQLGIENPAALRTRIEHLRRISYSSDLIKMLG